MLQWAMPSTIAATGMRRFHTTDKSRWLSSPASIRPRWLPITCSTVPGGTFNGPTPNETMMAMTSKISEAASSSAPLRRRIRPWRGAWRGE